MSKEKLLTFWKLLSNEGEFEKFKSMEFADRMETAFNHTAQLDLFNDMFGALQGKSDDFFFGVRLAFIFFFWFCSC